jgi:hypothetical protein
VKEGTILITIPTIELAKIDKSQEGDSAINQAVVKKAKKQWVINPNGKSWVRKIHRLTDTIIISFWGHFFKGEI